MILFGLLPALVMSGLSPLESMQAASRSHTDGPRGSRLRAALVGTEVAITMPLLIGAALLLASFERVLNVPRGLQMENLVSVHLVLPDFQSLGQRVSFSRRVLDGVSSLPGVQRAAFSNGFPLLGPPEIAAAIPEGSENVPFDSRPITGFVHVSSDYFRTLGIPLRSGRLFTPGEQPLVAVISEKAAQRVWPGQNPIGKRVQDHVGPTRRNHWFTVVGVVGDVRSEGLIDTYYPPIYIPYWQMEWWHVNTAQFLIVRTMIEPKAISAAIREQIWKVDRNIPVNESRTVAGIMLDSVAPRRFQALMATIFAAVAVLLASIGIYGVIAYTVAQRRIEIGVRLALGANPSNVKSMTLRQGLRPVVIGLGIGIAGAMVVARLLANLLFEVRPFDTIAFLTSVALVMIVAVFACYLPARNAANTDPLTALRYE